MHPNSVREQFLLQKPLDPQEETKRFFETTHRLSAPEETFERFGPRREAAGITRLADITKLDVVGIPTYNAVRPQVEYIDHNITIYNGKGSTKMQAKVSAMMEAFERQAGERKGRPALLKSYRQMVQKYRHVVHPEELVLMQGDPYDHDETLEWVCGSDLVSGEDYWLPAASVFCPYVPLSGAKEFRNFNDTNGLASGNTLGEAICYGLSELIERDALVMAKARDSGVSVDLESIDHPTLRPLLQKFTSAGIHLFVKDITSEIGVPTFAAASDDPGTEDPLLLCAGMGTHLDAEIALVRAITEVAQTRCGAIAGSREDLDRIAHSKRREAYCELKNQMPFWFRPTSQRKAFQDIPIVRNGNTLEDILFMLQGLAAHGFHRAIVFNLTDPRVQVPVIRTVVPGLEPSHEQKMRFGPRHLALLKERLSASQSTTSSAPSPDNSNQSKINSPATSPTAAKNHPASASSPRNSRSRT